MRQTPPAHHAKILPPHTQKFPPNPIQPPFGQLANNIPQTPSPLSPSTPFAPPKPPSPLRRYVGAAVASHEPLGHASEAEGEGVEPSRPRGPAAFEAVYRANGSPSVWLRQESNLHHTV